MAVPQSNAPLRADTEVPTSGVIHVRTRLTADFTVLSNTLAQRRGSAVTVGVAAYIASLPDGAPVSISALCRHFDEGDILISRALRELESAGFLERRRERLPSGQIRTRTFFYDVPDGGPGGPGHGPEGPRGLAEPAGGGESGAAAGPATPRESTDTASPASPTGPSATSGRAEPMHPDGSEGSVDPSERSAPALTDADPAAVAVLSGLRRVDPRLVLSAREAVRLAPAVGEWLAAGVGAREITELLTTRLPDRLRGRPAGILAFRLRETPLPAPPPLPPAPDRPAVLPFQTCDGCERAFRAPAPGRCRGCRGRDGDGLLRAAG